MNDSEYGGADGERAGLRPALNPPLMSGPARRLYLM